MRSFLQLVAGLALACFVAVSTSAAQETSRPNVLFIAIDDLNDWIGPLGGHPQVKTPNMDRLARRGVVFVNAHCAAPLCNPSRAAVFSGRQPFETGVFSNSKSSIRKVLTDDALLPRHFKQAGYRTFGTGKLLHSSSRGLFDEEYFPHQRWSPFDSRQVDYTAAELPSKGTLNPRHATTLKGREVVLPLNRMPSDRAPDSPGGESFDWGPLDVDDEDMGDGQIATWAVEALRAKHEQPFFVAVGFYRPHIPLFAPKRYFDLYEGVGIKLPETKADDLDDLSPGARELALEAGTAGAHATVLKFRQWQAAVKAYLACVSFVDAQVGRLLDAIDAGPNAGNTVIVLWGDHGWHLGEKQHWGKWTGWERSTHVPLIVAPARDAKAMAASRGQRCAQPVSLLDLYPTFIKLGSLPPRDGLSGRSLVPLLENPAQTTGRVVLTTFGKGNYSVTGQRWHYIRYEDGSEELYDRAADPHEWSNLAARPEHALQKASLAKHLPKDSAAPDPATDSSKPAKKKTKQPNIVDQAANIDLSHWKLTLPVDASGTTNGKAAELSATQLTSGYQGDHFYTDSDGSIVFWCPVNGATTDGTEFPRSELREMLDAGDPSVNWTAHGTHILEARCRVMEVPSNPKVIIGQIHSYSGKSKPLIKLQYYKGRIEALVKVSPTAGKDRKLTFPEVGLDNDIAYQIKLQNGVLSLTVNGRTQTENIVDNDADWANQTFYFKAGVYPQDNDGPASEGSRVAFSVLKVSHAERLAPHGGSAGPHHSANQKSTFAPKTSFGLAEKIIGITFDIHNDFGHATDAEDGERLTRKTGTPSPHKARGRHSALQEKQGQPSTSYLSRFQVEEGRRLQHGYRIQRAIGVGQPG